MTRIGLPARSYGHIYDMLKAMVCMDSQIYSYAQVKYYTSYYRYVKSMWYSYQYQMHYPSPNSRYHLAIYVVRDAKAHDYGGQLTISHSVALPWVFNWPLAQWNPMAVLPHVILLTGLHNHGFLLYNTMGRLLQLLSSRDHIEDPAVKTQDILQASQTGPWFLTNSEWPLQCDLS